MVGNTIQWVRAISRVGRCLRLPRGRRACDEAFQVIADAVSGMVEDIGSDKVRAALPVLREIRLRLGEED